MRPKGVEYSDATEGELAIFAKAAEMALALKNITQVSISRRGTYAKAPQASIDEFLARLT